MSIAEDIPLFFADFGETVNLGGVEVTGIFDLPGEFDPIGGGIVVGRARLTLPSASLPADPVGATLMRAGKVYSVRSALPDGTGVTTLELEAA